MAEVIGNLDPKRAGFSRKALKEMASKAWPENVRPFSIGPEDKATIEMHSFALENGLKLRKTPLFYDDCILPLRGSISWHKDFGFGAVLSWLIFDEPAFRNCYEPSVQLITRKGQLELIEGDIFWFNSNAGHAWLSNSKCVLVQTTIKHPTAKAC